MSTCSDQSGADNSPPSPSTTSDVEMETKCDLSQSNTDCADRRESVATCDCDSGSPSSVQAPMSKDRNKIIHVRFIVVFIAVTAFLVMAFVVPVVGLGLFYVRGVQVEVDRLKARVESQCGNQTFTPFMDSSKNSDFSEISQRLSSFVDEVRNNISSLREAVSLIQEVHSRDTDEARRNTTVFLRQVTDLNSSLMMLSSETWSNFTQLNTLITDEVHTLKNNSLIAALNISALTEQVTALESRSHDLERHTDELRTATSEYRTQLASLALNVSGNREQLHNLRLTQGAMLEVLQENLSILHQNTEELTENLTTSLSDIKTDLSRMNTTLRVELKNLTDVDEYLYSELNSTREEFNVTLSALEKDIAHLDNDTAEQLVNLQEDLRNEFSDFGDKLSIEVTTLKLSITRLNESLLEIDEGLQNVSEGQRDLQRELYTSKGELLTNVSAVERELQQEIQLTQERLQSNVSSLRTEINSDLAETRERFTGSISALNESIRATNEGLNITSSSLLNLSSLHGQLQQEVLSTKEDFSIHRSAVQWNISQLFDLVHSVDRNHTLITDRHSDALRVIQTNASVLTQRLHNVSESQRTQGEKITSIKTSLDEELTTLSGTLTSRIDSKTTQLGTQIDDHVEWIQRLFNEQSLTLDRFGNRIHQVEVKLSNGASTAVPLKLLVLSLISCLVTYAITLD